MPQRPPKDSNQKTAIDLLAERLGWKRIGLIALAACVVIVPPVVFLTGGGSDERSDTSEAIDPARATAAGCTVHTFEHGVTDDPEAGRAYEQEALFGSHPPLPRAGWQQGGRPPALVNILHSLTHEWLVVKYSPRLPRAQNQRLHQWADRNRKGVAVVPGGSDLPSAFAAIRWGHGLDCREVTPVSIALLGEFERKVKASLPGA